MFSNGNKQCIHPVFMHNTIVPQPQLHHQQTIHPQQPIINAPQQLHNLQFQNQHINYTNPHILTQQHIPININHANAIPLYQYTPPHNTIISGSNPHQYQPDINVNSNNNQIINNYCLNNFVPSVLNNNINTYTKSPKSKTPQSVRRGDSGQPKLAKKTQDKSDKKEKFVEYKQEATVNSKNNQINNTDIVTDYFHVSIDTAGNYIFNKSTSAYGLFLHCLNWFGHLQLNSNQGGIYEWDFVLTGNPLKVGGVGLAIGVYGTFDKSWYSTTNSMTGRRGPFAQSFYSAYDRENRGGVVGYAHIINQGLSTSDVKIKNTKSHLTNAMPTSYKKSYRWNLSKIGDIITMRLDLNNYTISYKRKGIDLGVAFSNIKHENIWYQMAIKFGKKCNTRSIQIKDFRIIQHKRKGPLYLFDQRVPSPPKRLPPMIPSEENTSFDDLKVEKTDCSTENRLESHNLENIRQVIIKRLDLEDTFIQMTLNAHDNIGMVKKCIEQKCQILSKEQRLIFGRKELNNDCILSHFGSGNELVLYLVPIMEMNDEIKEIEVDISAERLHNTIRFKNMQIIKMENTQHTLVSKIKSIEEDKNSGEKTFVTLEREMKKQIQVLEEKNEKIEKLWSTAIDTQTSLMKRIMELENKLKRCESKEKLLIEQEKENECVACMDLKRSHICLPCAHLCLCQQCANKMNNVCPLCQSKCTGIVKVFR